MEPITPSEALRQDGAVAAAARHYTEAEPVGTMSVGTMPRPGEITCELDRQDRIIRGLSEVVDTLTERLGPVVALRDAETRPAAIEEVRRPSPLAERIGESNDALAGVMHRLEDLVRAVDL